MSEYSGYIYRASTGETFDDIALAVYGDERRAADIMQLNPHLVGCFVFDGGEQVMLPVIEKPQIGIGGETVKSRAPWKEG